MAQQVSHSNSDASSEFSLDSLPTLSRVAETRALILEGLARDLRRADFSDWDGNKRLADTLDVLLNGCDAQLDREGLDTMLRLDVPRALVAGDTRRAG